MMGNKSFVFRFGDVEVREREFSLTKAAEVLPVEPKAFRVLLLLLHNPQKLITKEELLNAVWGDAAVTENSLARSIALLRRLLGDDIRSPRYIETVATVGYRFLGNVEVAEDPTVVPVTLDPPATARSGVATAADPASPVAREPARRRFPRIGFLAAGAAAAILLAIGSWYPTRPLLPPRVTEYVKLTHDGNIFNVGGTDGSRIYFDSTPWGSVDEVGASGGEIAKVPIDLARIGVADVSPDGSSLLVVSLDPAGLWTVGTVGGSPRLLSNHPVGSLHTWSPDGKSIAYCEYHVGLDLMQSDGTNAHRLLDVKGFITSIAWSPDGSRIRFTVDDALWEVSSSGSNPHPLLPAWHGPVGQCCGRWTPNGDFFVFLAGGNSGFGPKVGAFEQIWALDERHHLLQKITSRTNTVDLGPDSLGKAGSQPGRSKDLCLGRCPPRRTGPLRLQIQGASSIPWGHFCRVSFVLRRREPGSLRHIPRWHSLAGE
jgi:DNA-binding winged helix-turn-helix (wHTH) protein